MNIVYLGTPDFAVLPLVKLIKSNKYNIVAVVTNPDKPFGRKGVLTPPPVKVVAKEYNIPVYQYNKISCQGVEDLKKLNPDLMITCAYGQILSKEILNIPRFGVINIHASLLPKYRGASPIHFALLNGEKETGVTIMKTEVGVDTGDMILSRKININYDETCGELFERLSTLGSEMILEVLPTIFDGSAKLIPQDDKLATYTKIFRKQDALIDWGDAAENIYNKIRAFNPSPVAYCAFNGEPFKIYKAKVVGMSGKAGEILKADNELVIGCGKDALSLLIVQKAGGKAMGIGDFLNGNKFSKGEFFN